jgi:hypothetical protein
MGTWGTAFDENDEAADFLDEVSSRKDWNMVRSRIDGYMETGGYLDAQDAVAALELAAAAIGRPPEGMGPDLASWASLHRVDAEAHRDACIQAVDAVRNTSELSELWNETVVDPDDRTGWYAAIDGLRTRLVG